MSPRHYRLQQRQGAVDATRQRIIEAATRVLTSGAAFSIEAAAREAGVARPTVYEHFGAREALLDAVFDGLAESGGLFHLPEAFSHDDPFVALERFIDIFCGFYGTHRAVLRRLNALAVLGQAADAVHNRNARRLDGLRVLLGRIAAEGHFGADADEVIKVAHALTSFAFVDELAGADRDPVAVAPRIVAIVRETARL